MIQHFGENSVFRDPTRNTEVETTCIPLDRYEALVAENKSWRAERLKLLQQVETLHNCWQETQAKVVAAHKNVIVWVGRSAFQDAEIRELRRQVQELSHFLNPKEEQASGENQGRIT